VIDMIGMGDANETARNMRLSEVADFCNGPASQLSLRVLFAGEPVFRHWCESHDEYLARLAAWRSTAIWRPWPPGR
jgi:hypothetical protein